MFEELLTQGLRPLLPVNALDFADASKRLDWVEHRNLTVFSLRDERNPLLTVDLFAREPIPFNELWSRADRVALGCATVPIASIPDLIAMKRAAARPQDAIDIAQLEAIARKRNG